MKIGYIRVSTQEQNETLQVDALKDAGCEKFFTDKSTGARFERKGLEETLFTGWFFGQTAWEASLQEEVWRTFLDKQRSTGKQLQRWPDDRRRFAK